jgi:cytochrome bd-type quinol oxidase subunit 2
MIKKLKLLMLSLSSVIMFAAPLAIGATASAQNINQGQINQNLCSGSNGDVTGNQGTGCDASAANSVNHLITVVVNVLSVVVGVIAVIMIIVAGLRYITSGGKQESVTSAKNTILYAIIGLVIVALAQLIVHFVLNKTNSATS